MYYDIICVVYEVIWGGAWGQLMHEMAGGTSKVNQYIYCKISSFLAEGLTIY